MDPDFSSYSPPRASRRWISRRTGQDLDRLWLALRRGFHRSPLGSEIFLSLRGVDLLACALIPGRGYSILGQVFLGRVFLGGWAACGLLALALLPHELLLGWMVGGMASCHASGLGFLLLRQIEASEGSPPRLTHRILVPLACWAIYAMAVYWPGFGLFRRTVANPLHLVTENRSIVFNPSVRRDEVQRGDLIAFHSTGFRVQAAGQVPILAAEGPMLGRVVGLPGDRVEFGPRGVRVNGRAQPRLDTMPTEGGLEVEAGHWLVWPTVRIQVNNAPGLDMASLGAAFSRISRVEQSEFLGRAYNRWFLQRQDLP